MKSLLYILDAIILISLILNIMYCLQLNRKMQSIIVVSQNTEEVFNRFDGIWKKIAKDVTNLQEIVHEKGSNIDSLISEASNITRELNMFIGSGEILIKQLDQKICDVKDARYGDFKSVRKNVYVNNSAIKNPYANNN